MSYIGKVYALDDFVRIMILRLISLRILRNCERSLLEICTVWS
jgi:hypothetical protein